MTTVLRILRNTDLVAQRPTLDAYKRRGEARPAFQKALARSGGCSPAIAPPTRRAEMRAAIAADARRAFTRRQRRRRPSAALHARSYLRPTGPIAKRAARARGLPSRVPTRSIVEAASSIAIAIFISSSAR